MYHRRASRQEFASVSYIVYLNFATAIYHDGKLIDDLIRYGADVLYPKLLWPVKQALLEISNQGNVPYKQKIFNKVSIDIMLADYNELLIDLNLEGIIQMIAQIKSISSQQNMANAGRSELWNKLQILLSMAFEIRHNEYEVLEYEN